MPTVAQAIGSLLRRGGFLGCAVWMSGVAGAAQPTISFDRQIRPILSDTCYKCHGPDEGSRKAHLRLDTREGAFRIRDGKRVIVPGNSAGSEMLKRLRSADPDYHMPPPSSLRKLTDEQVSLIAGWIDQGAKWEDHWSFVPPTRAALPAVKTPGWCRNGIDRFVLAGLESRGLAPAPEATREALLRRVTFDLTGLPPTPGEIDAFLADRSPNAYEKVIDRLLASARFGERMAVTWLDLARFADTHGYQRDRYRPMWPYRDWVINAFNRNLPYNEFVTEQLAGDLLPNPTKQQRLATAFNRLHMQNEEGGIIEEEYRVAYNLDRVETFGTAFLGLTFQCSRCHDHKFDPITQKDYYSLFAFFQNIDESGQTSFFTDSMPVPTLLLSDDATDKKLADLRRQIAKKCGQIEALRSQSKDAFARWLSAKGALPKPAGLVGEFHFDEIRAGKIANSADPSKPGHLSDNPVLVPGKFGKAAQLSGDNGFTFPGLGHVSRADPFSIGIWLNPAGLEPRMVVLHHSKAPIDAGSRGYELLLENGRVAFGLHHMWPGNSLKVVTRQAIPVNAWTHVAVTYDGSSRARGVHVYVNGIDAPLEVVRDGLYKDITYSAGEPNLEIGFRFRDNGFKGGRVDDFCLFDRAISPPQAAALAGRPEWADAWSAPPEHLTDSQRESLLDYYLANVSDAGLSLTRELHALRAEEARTVERIPEAMVMQELPHPKPAYILKRGQYDSHGEQVWANTPGFLPPLPPGEPHNRLGLAHWLFEPSNPLAGRVMVNRLWQQMFGQGIVATSDNFGAQGSPPSDPQLLDWLACEFRDGGWDVKRMLKLIATSATYQQSSKVSPELLASDPDNSLLARGPARRLTAEMLRDQALADAGLLVEKLGGPSVKPYQPPGVWDVAMGRPHYDQGHGDDLHRRSLYTYWKRSVPPPSMTAFDASDRSSCVVRRQSTSTPLQALTLLNDVQFTEAARFISQRTLREAGKTPEDRAKWMFLLVAGRSPSDKELAVLVSIYTEQRQIFLTDPNGVRALLAVGEAKNDPSLDPLDLAAGTVLAEAILNSDDAIMRR